MDLYRPAYKEARTIRPYNDGDRTYAVKYYWDWYAWNVNHGWIFLPVECQVCLVDIKQFFFIPYVWFAFECGGESARINVRFSPMWLANMRLYVSVCVSFFFFFIRKPRAIEWNPMNFASKFVRLGFFAQSYVVYKCAVVVWLSSISWSFLCLLRNQMASV